MRWYQHEAAPFFAFMAVVAIGIVGAIIGASIDSAYQHEVEMLRIRLQCTDGGAE